MFGFNAKEREGVSLLSSSLPDGPYDDKNIDIAKVASSMFWYKGEVCIKSTDIAEATGEPHNQILLAIRRHFNSIGRRPRFGQVGRQPHPLILDWFDANSVMRPWRGQFSIGLESTRLQGPCLPAAKRCSRSAAAARHKPALLAPSH
jgi:hypothetical protein